ncbi:MAG: hypothetical protein CMF61_01565 [Magnetococcales bacterium]|nr:hypothetical protein [Magnetococcales bacterium]PPR19717.1 MAG: hypothetical protein CFH43_00038 [Pseudomonadota bacterium]|tara:strand:+ start:511 stop:843 length:333 start_codon:yes stop_codon:yes gene_type:complete
MFVQNMIETRESLASLLSTLQPNQRLVAELTVCTECKRGLWVLNPMNEVEGVLSLTATDDFDCALGQTIAELSGHGMKNLGAKAYQMYSDVNDRFFKFDLTSTFHIVTLH